MPSLSQRAYDHIREKLIRGDVDSKQELSETRLVGELGISRTPIREAIRRLESEGLLDQIPKRGTYIRRPTRQDIAEIYQVRLLLEPFAAGQAALHASAELVQKLDDEVQKLFEIVDKIAAATSERRRRQWMGDHAAADLRFHELLLAASDNRRIAKIVGDAQILRQALGYPKDVPGGIVHSLPEVDREHAEIAAAIRSNDAQAAEEAMRRHLLRGRERAIEYFDWLEQQPSDDDAA